MNIDTKKKFIINVAYIVTVYAVLYFIFKYMIHWIMPFVVGFLIASSLKPIARYITKITRIKGKSVSIFVISMFYAIVGLILWFLISFLWNQTFEFIYALPKFYFENVEPILFGINDWLVERTSDLSPELSATISDIIQNMIDYLATAIKNISVFLVSFATDIISNFPLYLISIIFTIVLSVFISTNYYEISAFIKKQLPEKFNSTFAEARIFVSGTLLKMIKAYAKICLITFFEIVIGLALLKVEYRVPIAAIVAVLDIMPVLGTGGVLIPWAIIELISKDYTMGFGLLGLYVFVTVARNIIEPRIVGKQIGLHPIITITAMYAGLRLFGFVGFISAPMIAILIKYLNDSGKINLYK